MRPRYWLYRLQERLYCTEQEALFLLGSVCLLVAGATLRSCASGVPEHAAASLARMDSLFFSLASVADSLDAHDITVWENPSPPDTLEGPIVVNTATAADLERLPRIGPALAARILARRQKVGSFRRIEDLLDVPGIGEKTLERLRPFIVLDRPEPADSVGHPGPAPPG